MKISTPLRTPPTRWKDKIARVERVYLNGRGTAVVSVGRDHETLSGCMVVPWPTGCSVFGDSIRTCCFFFLHAFPFIEITPIEDEKGIERFLLNHFHWTSGEVFGFFFLEWKVLIGCMRTNLVDSFTTTLDDSLWNVKHQRKTSSYVKRASIIDVNCTRRRWLQYSRYN